MTDGADNAEPGWFAGLEPDDTAAHARAIAEGSAESPADWPTRAREAGFVDSTDAYYERLHSAALRATRAAVSARERAADQRLIHEVRALEDCERVANELDERLAEWAGALGVEPADGDVATAVIALGESDSNDSGSDRDETATVATAADGATPDGPTRDTTFPDAAILGVARQVVSLREEADRLRETVERRAHEVAPNLATLAGPILAARLVALAGGLEDLARKPSGTVQVLGAEEALFAHLEGHAPSPKHGVIYTHPAVRRTTPEHRGSAARALAGKLAIAARIDHYSGDRRPELERELAERIDRIRSRTDP